MIRRGNIVFILLILIVIYINDQNTKWSLAKCIAHAKENNLQIKQAGYNVEIARTNLNAAKNAYLPEANANASQQYYLGRSVNPYTYTFSNNNNNSGNFSLNGSVELFKGFQRIYDVKQNNFTLQAVLMDIEKAKNDLSLNITSVFLELLFYDELIRNDSVQFQETEDQAGRADELVKTAQFRLQSAESNIEYTKGYQCPVLSFKTSLNSGYASYSSLFDALENKIDCPYNNQIKDNVNMYYGFSITVPVFNRFQVRNSIRLANYKKSKAEVNVELIQKQVYKDVQKEYYDIIAANEKMTSTKTLLNATELSIKYADEKLKSGIISVYDYSTMKTKLAKAISNFLQAKYEYIFKIRILDFYAGKPITLENQ